jgi:hypothetical protein
VATKPASLAELGTDLVLAVRTSVCDVFVGLGENFAYARLREPEQRLLDRLPLVCTDQHRGG